MIDSRELRKLHNRVNDNEVLFLYLSPQIILASADVCRTELIACGF